MRWFWLLLLLCAICPAACAEETVGFALTTCSTGSVSVMADSSTLGEPLAECDSGVWVATIAREGDWYQVETEDGKAGYIQAEYLNKISITYHLYGIVQNDSEREFLNLRAQPSYQANVLGTYYNGVPCIILSRENDGWYHVMVDGVEGYFREEYIREMTLPYGERVATIHSKSRYGVNMRTGPGFMYPASRLCIENSYVTVIQKGTDWWMISDAGAVGFIRSQALYDGILNPVFQDQSVTGATAIVNNPKATQVLNMREKPTRFSTVLGQFSNGTRFTLLQQGTQWCRVSDNDGHTGWCMTQFLTLQGAPDVPTKKVIHEEKTYVNLRAAPSSVAGAILTQVPHGAEVTVLIPDLEEWTMVDYEGMTGYMYSTFLK